MGNVKKLTDVFNELGIAWTVYQDITGEPTDCMVDKGLEMYVGEKCDFLTAVGGGSPIDSMKAIGALAGNGGKIRDITRAGRLQAGHRPWPPCPHML